MTGHRQALCFVTVGAAGTAVNLAVFVAARALGAPPHVASVAAFLVACAGNGALHGRVTFGHRRRPTSLRTLGYVAVSAMTLLVNIAVLGALLAAGPAPLLAQFGGIAVACPLNYLLSSRLVFRAPRPAAVLLPPAFPASN